MNTLQNHQLSELFPLLEGKPFDELVDDIRLNGQREKIVLLDGKILDGRNRYKGCLAAGIEPATEEFQGENPAAFVWSKNGQRRHLSSSQLAAIGAEIAIHIREEAKCTERPLVGTSAAAIAAAMQVGVSPRSVETALAVRKKSPAKFAKVKAGKMSLNAAEAPDREKKAKARKEAEDQERTAALKRIGKVCGMGFSLAVEKGTILKPRSEAIKFANLEVEDMERIKLLVQEHWTVAKALKFRMTGLARTHKIKDLLDRAAAQGGSFELNIEGWKVTVKKL